MGATTRVARLAALGHKRHSKPIYNMMSIKLPRPQYVVSGLIFSPFHPSKLWLNQPPYRSKRTYQRANTIRFDVSHHSTRAELTAKPLPEPTRKRFRSSIPVEV